MAENLQTTRLKIISETDALITVQLPNEEKINLPKNIFPVNRTADGYYFLTLSHLSRQEAVSKDLAQNILNELINTDS